MEAAAPISVHPEATLGWRVAVYWSGDDAWFRGHVSAFDASSGELHVEYDDGDRDTIVLGVDRVRFLAPPKRDAASDAPPYTLNARAAAVAPSSRGGPPSRSLA